MSMRERMLAAYRNQVPDRVPVCIYTRYLPRGATERQIRNLGLGIVEYHPVVSLLAPPWHILPGYLSEVQGADFDLRYRWEHGKRIERRIYTTPVGTVYQDVSQDPAGAGSEHIHKRYLTTREDYRTMQYIVEHTVFRRNEETIRAKIADLGDDGVLLGRMDRSPHQKILIELAGTEEFLLGLYTDPEPALALMAAMTAKMDEMFSLTLDSAVDVIWQPDNVTSDLTPPKSFAQYVLPFYQKHAAAVHAAGKAYIVHLDGRIRALQEALNQVDFDAIESLSFPEIGGDYTLSEARAAFPGKAILPNFPSNRCQESDDAIAAYVHALLDEAGTGTPFMLQISEDLPPEQWRRVLPIIAQAVNEHRA
jgi:uroporphyrinogen-III decarboxylase